MMPLTKHTTLAFMGMFPVIASLNMVLIAPATTGFPSPTLIKVPAQLVDIHT